ncbi:MAG: methyltransferase domain-containing protein [Chloroflexi bacterium]|nr:methyltransferase domain-containing protein [Chloroflexota bacterium]
MERKGERLGGATPAPPNLFGERYDAWYDGPVGRWAFPQECAARRPLLEGLPQPWLEVGVGTGRFAAALGVRYGLDPAPAALALARRRGIAVVQARGEELPLQSHSLGALLLIVTLCFVADPLAVLREGRRVLRPDGGLVLGLVLAESPWGRWYRSLAQAGHPYYCLAHFFTREEVAGLLDAAGFVVSRERSALFQPPTEVLRDEPAREGFEGQAGFSAILARPRC